MNTHSQLEKEIVIERIDDIPLLISLQQKLGVDKLIDDVIARHWLHQGLSLGQLVIGWSTYILSESDHRKVKVEDWAVEHQQILSEMLGTKLRRTDFTDDRLSQVLTHFSKDSEWYEIEQNLWHNSVSVYRLTPERIRLDASGLSGYHTPDADGLMQYGHNRQSPHRTQVKLMAASVDIGTSGHLLATDVVSGETADDPLYLPMIQRVRQTFDDSGLLYLGDSKMSAIEIRAELARGGDFYLVPLAKVGEVAKAFDQWVDDIVQGCACATLIYQTDAQGKPTELIAAGYQRLRPQQIELPTGQIYRWRERLLVVRSLADADKQFAALQRRIEKATQALWELTPQPGRGRRQIRSKAKLIDKADAILTQYQVTDYLQYTFVKQQQV